MSNLNVHLADARRDLRGPAMPTVMQDTCASMATVKSAAAADYRRTAIEATWLHTPKFGPNHHSQRWRQAS